MKVPDYEHGDLCDVQERRFMHEGHVMLHANKSKNWEWIESIHWHN